MCADSAVNIIYSKLPVPEEETDRIMRENNIRILVTKDSGVRGGLPEKIEKSMQTLKEKNADLVFGDLEVVDENLKTIYPSFGDFMLLNRKINKYIDSYQVNYLYNCVTGCTILSKKKFIKSSDCCYFSCNSCFFVIKSLDKM